MMQPWYWLVLGMVLMMLELFVLNFTLIWFGLGAALVALVLWAFPTAAFSIQIFLWAISSTLLTFLWYRYFRRMLTDKTNAGIAKEAIVGTIGLVIKEPIEGQHGMARFVPGLLGDDEWLFICDAPVCIGDRVRVKTINGNTLIVGKAGA